MSIWNKCVIVIWVAASSLAIQPAVALAPAQEAPQNMSAAGNLAKTALNNTAQKGFQIAAVTTVSDAASIQAVLIPAGLARRIFGKEVSQNYAVVELIISNRDANAALLVHSVFLDYRNWLLSGVSSGNLATTATLDDPQKANSLSQVASIESRLVRGELLDAQSWTPRNWTMRSLVALGSVGAGFAFPFSGDVAKGIAAFNGVVVPSAETLWPDGTVNQINRISDFGFQTNKIIPKQSSDIVVAFFPIDRFLTPGFRKVFLKNPAALFVPGEMLADPKMAPLIQKFLPSMAKLSDAKVSQNGKEIPDVRSTLLQAELTHCISTDEQEQKDWTKPLTPCQVKSLLDAISLNNIRVVLEGSMTVNVATVPATIYSVDFNDGNANASIWTTTAKEQDGKISGVYLSGGIPAVVDAQGKPIEGITITAVAEGSTDAVLNFKLTVSKCIPPTTKIYFVVNKPQNTNTTNNGATTTKQAPAAAGNQSSTAVPSTPFEFALPPYTCPPVAGTGGGAEANPGATNTAPANNPVPVKSKPEAGAESPQ